MTRHTDVALRAQTGGSAPRWTAAFAMWWLQYKRVWKGSLISRFLLPVMFLVSIGVMLGGVVDDRAGGVDGVPYLQFVVPGILAAQAMFVAMGESTYSVTGAIRWNMQYHAMLATPLTVADVLIGHLAYVAVSVSMAAVVFVGVGAAFGAWVSWWVLAAIPLVVLTGMAFSVPCFAFGAQVRDNTEMGYSLLFRFVMTPLFLFSGTFFPVEQLPALLRPLAWATPLWHGVAASRDLALGSPDWRMLAVHTTYLVVFVGLSGWWALRAFRGRLLV